MKKQYVFSQEEYNDMCLLLSKGLSIVQSREESLSPYLITECRNNLTELSYILTDAKDKQ